MQNLKHTFIAWLVLLITGCAVVTVSEPIGEKPVKLEVGDWEGTRIHEEGFLVTKVTNSEKGILKVGTQRRSNSYH